MNCSFTILNRNHCTFLFYSASLHCPRVLFSPSPRTHRICNERGDCTGGGSYFRRRIRASHKHAHTHSTHSGVRPEMPICGSSCQTAPATASSVITPLFIFSARPAGFGSVPSCGWDLETNLGLGISSLGTARRYGEAVIERFSVGSVAALWRSRGGTRGLSV